MSARLLWVSFAVLLQGCFLDFSGLTGGGASDGGSVDGGDSTGCTGAVRIAVGSTRVCVDETEVTRGQYQAFLAARGSDVSGQPGPCAWNDSFIPSAHWPPAAGEDHLPVVNVDWCDAWAYCGWAGKSLCGTPDHQAVPLASRNDSSVDVWFAACSRGGAQPVPYGNASASGHCVFGQSQPADVGTTAGCEGGYPGLFDLVGNVEEWVNACDGTSAGAGDSCLARGGDYSESATVQTCATDTSKLEFRSNREEWRGFRCCGG